MDNNVSVKRLLYFTALLQQTKNPFKLTIDITKAFLKSAACPSLNNTYYANGRKN